MEWEPGAPRFGVGGRFWQVPSDPNAPWARSIPEMLPGREGRPTFSPSKPALSYSLKINIPLLSKDKAGSHCSPGLQGVDDVIIGFFPH